MVISTSDIAKSISPKNTHSPPTRSGPAVGVNSGVPIKLEGPVNAPAIKPFAPPPPRPGHLQQGTNTPDYFAAPGGSLSLEPNPFEHSFGVGGGPETPGGTKLPPVAALTSPSSLLPGSNATPFNWGGGSLRTGPLSPAMLSGPATDYFSDTHHLRGSFPTPNESSLRTGLTPGGSGSMFPAPSPNTQAIFSNLANGGSTPGTIDFHRAALSAATQREQSKLSQQQQQQQSRPPPPPPPPPPQQPPSVTSQPQEMPNVTSVVKSEPKPASGPFDPHDNDAANGLYMLAQGRNVPQNSSQFAVGSAAPAPAQRSAAPIPPSTNKSPHLSGTKIQAPGPASEGSSNMSDESDQVKPQPRGKGKRGVPTGNNRRKADESSAKLPASKRSRNNIGPPDVNVDDHSDYDDLVDIDKQDDPNSKSKMTDEEKRKNFLERNRVAALKCRQRKKQWLANLQNKVELYTTENDNLTQQITQLREEVVNLKTLLLAHKDCAVTQQQGLHGAFMSQVVEPFNPQMNPYGMPGAIPNQQVMTGQGVQRRYS